MSANSKREIVSIHVGQTGCKIGSAFWENLLKEYNIDKNGSTNSDVFNDEIFFKRTSSNKIVPRCIFVDTDPQFLNGLKSGEFKNMYDNDRFITGLQGTSLNYADGYYGQGKVLISSIMEQIRDSVMQCSNLEGFLITHSLDGGTGSGLTSLLLERLSEDYGKKSRCEICVYPTLDKSDQSLQVYNSVLGLQSSIEHANLSICIDNAALNRICTKKLELNRPTFDDYNQLIGYFMCSFSSPIRHSGCLSAGLNDIIRNMTPYPRIHFAIPSLAPLQSKAKLDFKSLNGYVLTNNLFLNDYQFLSCDVEKAKYISCYLSYQGKNFEMNDIYNGIEKNYQTIKLVDWSPNPFKISLNSHPPYSSFVNSIDLNTVCRVCSTTAFGNVFSQFDEKFDNDFSNRKNVDLFLNKSMEEGQFREAREDLAAIEKDYEEIGVDSVEDA